MKTTSIKNVAEFVVIYCKANGLTISPLKLQKLLYYIQAWHIANFNRANIFEEMPEAWVNGPVYRSIYAQYASRFFKSENIQYKINGNLEDVLKSKSKDLNLEDKQLSLINSVLKFYAPKDAGALVIKTHTDKPWNDARQGLGPFDRSTNEISIESMYTFYNGLLA